MPHLISLNTSYRSVECQSAILSLRNTPQIRHLDCKTQYGVLSRRFDTSYPTGGYGVSVTTSRYVVPTSRVKVHAGRYVVPTGKDNVIVSAGRSKVIPADLKLDLEELDIKWQMAMLSVRINRFEKKARKKMKFNNRDAPRFDKKKVKCYKCSKLGHFARECTGKQLDSKARYSAFKLKSRISLKEPKALLSVDSMLNWSDHEGEDEEKGAAQVYGMIAGDDVVHTCPFGCEYKYAELKKDFDNLEVQYKIVYPQIPIVVGTVWRRLVSKVSVVMISNSMCGYLDDLQFGVRVSGGGEAILHTVNRLIEDRGDDVGLLMLLVDFKNAFNLVDREVMLKEVRLRCPAISCWVEFCYSNPVRLYYGEHTLRSCQGVQQGDPFGPLLFALVLHPLICKIKDSFNLSLQAWYLDDGTIIGDTLVMGKALELIMEDGPNGPTSLDATLLSALERIVTASRPGFVDWQWRLSILPFVFWGLGVYSAASGNTFDDALCVFSTEMEIDILSNPKSTFSLSSTQMALWQSQMEDHTSYWLKVVLISGLGQTMNDKTYCCVLCYLLCVPLFFVSKPCPACSKVFTGDIYGDHDVSCAGIIGIKHRHNVVRETLVDICFRLGISDGKEVDIRLGGECDKPYVTLFEDEELDVCVDLTGSSPLMQSGWLILCSVVR
ncbi:putative reverse transcriptase domain-containing protein [Tanacetum coccineum]